MVSLLQKTIQKKAEDNSLDEWLKASGYNKPSPLVVISRNTEWNETKLTNIKRERSQPIIIQITNSGGGAVNNVFVYDSYKVRTLGPPWGNAGSTITINSNIQGVSYLEMLGNSENKQFRVGRTMIISTTPGQVEVNISITHRNDLGDKIDSSFSPVIDPYQNQKDRVVSDEEYILDGFTKINFAQILPNALVTIRFYPKLRFTGTAIANNEDPILEWDEPKIFQYPEHTTMRLHQLHHHPRKQY